MTATIKGTETTVNPGDKIVAIVSAPAKGKWGGYSRPSVYTVKAGASGKLVCEHVSHGKSFTSAKKVAELAAKLAEKYGAVAVVKGRPTLAEVE